MNYFLALFSLQDLEEFELIMLIVVIFLIILALIDMGAFSKSREKLKLGGVGLGLGSLGIILLIAYFSIPYIVVGIFLLVLMLVFGGLGGGKSRY